MSEQELNLQCFEDAVELNKEYRDKLKANHCYFRAGFDSLTLTSLHQDSPDLGEKKIKAEQLLKMSEIHPERMDMIIESLKMKSSEASQPEKKLQSFLINEILYGDTPKFWLDLNLEFITSELRLPIPPKEKRKIKSKKFNNDKSNTNDILAVDENGALWIVELKNKRKKTDLLDQLADFHFLVLHHKTTVQNLVKALSSNGNAWNGIIVNKMIIWEAGTPEAIEKTSPNLSALRVETIGFNIKRNKYEFNVESKVRR